MTAQPSAVGRDAAREEHDRLLRRDFASFALRSFRELNPRTPFAMNWHVELIAAKLAAVYHGRIRRLIVSLPPRHLKSHLASVAFPAWCLGHEPGAQILCVSYAQDLADKLSRDCRRIFAADWYQRLFPTRLSPQRQAVPEFETTAPGLAGRHLGRRCADRARCRHHRHRRPAEARGGVVASPAAGGERMVRPYPLQPIERQAQGCDRADHAPAAREGGDDLAGHVMAQEAWEVVRIPAIAEDDERHRAETVFGRQCFGRKAGEALHAEREPPQMIEQIRRTIGEYNFAGQYQQAPAPQGGGMVKAAWFRNYAANERPDPFDRVVQSWDTANKASELSDFSVCTSWGLKGKDLYLLHVLRKRMEYPELKRAVREQWEAFEASVVLIEDKASGTQLIQELIAQGLHAVTRYQPQSDKIMRMHAQTAMIENGFVHLPKESGMARRIPARADGLPQGQARRPGRLDRPDARLAEARRPRAAGLDVAII